MKPVEGYEDKYLISEEGKVFSLISNRFLKGTVNSNGYLVVQLCKGKRVEQKQFLIHRLVAQAFLKKDKERIYVNHKDGNKQNAHVSNLEWCSSSENELHSYKVLKKKPSTPMLNRKGALCPSSKKVASLNKYTLEIIKVYDCITEVEKDGFIQSGVSSVVLGKRNYHGKLRWIYFDDIHKTMKATEDLKLQEKINRSVSVSAYKNGIKIKSFICLKDAASFINVKSIGNISSCCRGKRNTVGGYNWKYD